MGLKSFLSTGVLSAFFIVPAQASEFHIALGFSDAPISSARIALRSAPFDNRWLPNWMGSPRLFVEPSVNHIEDTRDGATSLTILAVSPVIQWQLTQSPQPLFIEAGIGAALMDRVQAGGRTFSTSFQFEDMLRVSWQYSSHSKARISAAYVHYSNAGVRHPNDGINLFQISWVSTF